MQYANGNDGQRYSMANARLSSCASDCTFLEAMAAVDTSEPAQTFLECGLCFENDELKRLPCNPDHIYCITCLTKDSERTKIIKCPQCRFVSRSQRIVYMIPYTKLCILTH